MQSFTMIMMSVGTADTNTTSTLKTTQICPISAAINESYSGGAYTDEAQSSRTVRWDKKIFKGGKYYETSDNVVMDRVLHDATTARIRSARAVVGGGKNAQIAPQTYPSTNNKIVYTQLARLVDIIGRYEQKLANNAHIAPNLSMPNLQLEDVRGIDSLADVAILSAVMRELAQYASRTHRVVCIPPTVATPPIDMVALELYQCECVKGINQMADIVGKNLHVESVSIEGVSTESIPAESIPTESIPTNLDEVMLI